MRVERVRSCREGVRELDHILRIAHARAERVGEGTFLPFPSLPLESHQVFVSFRSTFVIQSPGFRSSLSCFDEELTRHRSGHDLVLVR